MHAAIRRTMMGSGIALALAAAAALAQSPAPAANDQGQQTQQPQRTIQMVPVKAELDTTLDAKKAKQGQEVTAKLQTDVKAGDQNLPKNTVLEGHVDQVLPSENKGDSTVVVTFDKAKLKDGQELPIKATVVAIAEPILAQASEQASGGAMPTAGSGAPGGGVSGGGAPAGSSGGPQGTSAGNSSSPAASQPMNTPEAGSTSNGQQPSQTSVPGVTLTSDIHQQTSATFTSKGKNVHVPNGTEMEVALAVIPAGVHMQ